MFKKNDPLLKARWFHAFGFWKRLTLLLEPLVPLFRDSSEFYCLLGSGFLHLGDCDTAKTYLARACQLAPLDSDVGLLLAVSRIGAGEGREAAEICLDILERDPGNTSAHTAMKWIRDGQGCPGEIKVLSFKKLMAILPKGRFSDPGRRIAAGGLAAFLIAVVALAALLPGEVGRGKDTQIVNPADTGPQARLVAANPGKYIDVLVKWHGLATNPQPKTGSRGFFTLVAGSYNLKTVDALVEVDCPGNPPEAGAFVEVEGRISLFDASFRLVADHVVKWTGGTR